MQLWIDRAGYGNRDLTGALDSFWPDGAPRVSALQQIDLLVDLERGTLPFSARSQGIVRRILERERGDGFVVRGKTGYATACAPPVGWYVGWVERATGPLFFAMNGDLASAAEADRGGSPRRPHAKSGSASNSPPSTWRGATPNHSFRSVA